MMMLIWEIREEKVYMLLLIFYFSLFSFVSNSLAYITLPKNNGEIKINWDKN